MKGKSLLAMAILGTVFLLLFFGLSLADVTDPTKPEEELDLKKYLEFEKKDFHSMCGGHCLNEFESAVLCI